MIEVKGLKEVLDDLKRLGVEGEEAIAEITYQTAEGIRTDAVELVFRQSFDEGTLAKSIKQTKIDETNYKIGTKLQYAGYVEFGTGIKVSVPAELAESAATFKGKKGNFKDGLEAIKLWCKRKGIPIEAAYPIFVSLLRDGRTPQPFLYPAWKKGISNYIRDLKTGLEALIKKL